VRRELLNQGRRKCRRKGEENLAGLVVLADPFPRQIEGDSPGSRYLADGALPELERPMSDLPLLLRWSKVSDSHTPSHCQGCWWDAASDSAPVDVRCGLTAFSKLGEGSSQWFRSHGEGGNKSLRGLAAAEMSFEGAGCAGWS